MKIRFAPSAMPKEGVLVLLVAEGGTLAAAVDKLADHFLGSLQFSEVTERLQNPRAQFACAHRRYGPVKHTQQTRVACTARVDQLKIGLCGGIEQDVIRRRIAAQ